MKLYNIKKLAVMMTLVVTLVMTVGCGSPKEETLDTVDPFKYVTLGDYEGLRIDPVDTTVSDADIDANIESLLSSRATAKDAGDRTARMGDIVNIDYIGTENGVPFDGGTGNYDLELGSGSFISGFEEGVVGMSTGETKTLDLTFPEDYHSKELAGKAVQFEVTVNSISENVLPELTDEFVQDVSDEAETVEEYREYVRRKLTEQRESSAKANIQADLMKMAVDNAKCDEDKLPEWLISQNSAEYKSSVESFVSQTGMDLETYLSQTGTDVDTFYKQADDYGREIAKSQLVVKAIADQKGMKITDKELEDYYADYAAEYRTDVDSVRKAIPESELKNYLLQQKVMDHIYNEAVFNR